MSAELRDLALGDWGFRDSSLRIGGLGIGGLGVGGLRGLRGLLALGSSAQSAGTPEVGSWIVGMWAEEHLPNM